MTTTNIIVIDIQDAFVEEILAIVVAQIQALLIFTLCNNQSSFVIRELPDVVDGEWAYLDSVLVNVDKRMIVGQDNRQD